MGECAVYKYVCDGEIIYVGKTDSNLFQRIYAHKSEDKFLPFIDKCEIYYSNCKNPAHTAILETYLIDKYKPKLNKAMKYDDDLGITIKEPEWLEYDTQKLLSVVDVISRTPRDKKNSDIHPSDLVVLTAILAYKEDGEDWVEVSFNELSDFCGELVAISNVKRCVKNLYNNGFIDRIRGRAAKNKYKVLIPMQK